eukprot:INCI19271.1.p1 GENE.INCI19271.1~~INCI19271.1.p1  ORF type:complete len:544 (-),score=173.49 INCI19271.1:843-2474(-)
MSEKLDNPFCLPSDEEVFHLREKEREELNATRKQLKKLKVWEKTTQASRLSSTKSIREQLAPATQEIIRRKADGAQSPTPTPMAVSDHRHEKESMADFVAKKREMFLVQMALNTKRDEIAKLEEKAKLKQEALRKSELMLEEDTLHFEAFLKENDEKAHSAIRKAELETQKKNQKIQEIKKLKQAIQLVHSKMSKLKEQLELCQQYKKFLDDLTPAEYYEEQRALRQKKREEQRKARFVEREAEWEETKRAIEAEADAKEEELREKFAAAGKVMRKKDSVKDQYLAKIPPRPKLEDEPEVGAGAGEGDGAGNEDEDAPLYFTDPHQLLDIFAALEEENLFLIQNSQETEQALEELNQNFNTTRTKMEHKTALLKDNIKELESQIAAEQAKAAMLQQDAKNAENKDGQEQLLKDLNEKVKSVYVACGSDADANPTTLTMLTELEGKLEYLLSEMEKMDPEYVETAEKSKEKERRERVRQLRMKEQQEEYEARLRRSMERAAAPIKKQSGKPAMTRSYLKVPKKKKTKKNREEEEKKKQMERYFS